MRCPASAVLACAAIAASSVAAHGYVSYITDDRLQYMGFQPPAPDAYPLAVGWSTNAFDQGYVNQSGFQSPDIICHRGGKNAHAHARVHAGDTVHIQWDGWPESHKGPVLDYLAPCGSGRGGCEAADRLALSFFKVAQQGLVAPATADDGTDGLGTWATDRLIANNNSWAVRVPPRLAPGPYVLRTEIIALHNASSPDGAQNYPQCLNLQVVEGETNNSGGGNASDVLVLAPASGTPGRGLYDPRDPSFSVDIYAGLESYAIPGPPLISAVVADAAAQPPQQPTASLTDPEPTAMGPVYTGTGTVPATTPQATMVRRRRLRDVHASSSG
ncbi:putative endo-1,4-beta-glucanase [Xylariaceae sp. FL0804]|nr:putative endo-1,4-beta-glucanase [Xylariaceae sp. FL0804]